MSNPLAISAATAALRSLLEPVRTEFPGTIISARPLDEARQNSANNQLNLLLYEISYNESWRNRDLPRSSQPGETGFPPLALDLFYLLTAYGANNETENAHRVLGRAMNLMHDRPLLNRDQISTALPASDLGDQIERVRITPFTLSGDDMFRMWSAFQTEYRISVAYQISVVLIDSSREARTPLPVLERTVTAVPSLVPPFPAIGELITANGPSGARLGEQVEVIGHHLSGASVAVNLTTFRLNAPLSLAPGVGSTDTRVLLTLPDTAAAQTALVAGIYRLSAAVTTLENGQPVERVTNQLPLVVTPTISNISPNPISLGATTVLTLTVRPEVRSEQQVALLLGSHRFAPQAAVTGDTLTFDIAASAGGQTITPGRYFARLRIDGVDSIVIDHSADPLAFDSAVEVVVNP